MRTRRNHAIRSRPPAAPPPPRPRPPASTTRPGAPTAASAGYFAHLATLTRNQVRLTGAHATVPILAEPTSAQREAFDLIGAPIPPTLK